MTSAVLVELLHLQKGKQADLLGYSVREGEVLDRQESQMQLFTETRSVRNNMEQKS